MQPLYNLQRPVWNLYDTCTKAIQGLHKTYKQVYQAHTNPMNTYTKHMNTYNMISSRLNDRAIAEQSETFKATCDEIMKRVFWPPEGNRAFSWKPQAVIKNT